MCHWKCLIQLHKKLKIVFMRLQTLFAILRHKYSYTPPTSYRIMLGIKQQDCISNIAIHSMTNTEPLVSYVRKHQQGFLKHILGLPEEEPVRRYAFYVPPHGKRKPNRPRTSHITYIQQVLGYHEVEISAWDRCARINNSDFAFFVFERTKHQPRAICAVI